MAIQKGRFLTADQYDDLKGKVLKAREELKPNYGPVYAAAMYPGLAAIFHRHGYALAVHGSLARDFDLIAVPWVDDPSSHSEVLADVTDAYAVRLIGEPGVKPHGRMAYTISCGFGSCAIDLSFTSQQSVTETPKTPQSQ
jgi:hypothetical protein